MSYYIFITIQRLNAKQAEAFRAWLGNVKNSDLPESEWERLWNEFNEPEKENGNIYDD
jgi:hypothetical protein